MKKKSTHLSIGITSLIHIDSYNRNAECIIDIGNKDYWGARLWEGSFHLIIGLCIFRIKFTSPFFTSIFFLTIEQLNYINHSVFNMKELVKKLYSAMAIGMTLNSSLYSNVIINKKKLCAHRAKLFSYIIDQLALLKLLLCLYVPMIDLHQYVRSGRKLLFVCKLGDVSLAF